VGDVPDLVAYRAMFDRGAILAMSARHGIRLPHLHFTCAAELVETRLGKKIELSEALQALGLSFQGRHHDPLTDARAAAAVALACSRLSPLRRDP
jgi:DNA polymerase III epsilon subunit-like protein